jgi:hypothetical protein
VYDNRLSFDNINDLKFQYYDLNKNTKYFIITDQRTKKTIFLDKDLSYKLKSVDNENKISLIDYDKSINIYKSINNIISMIELKK